ncbi:MAG: hypothetical protein DRN33_05905, partial [Thermoplasmata archaeon]
MKNYTSMEMKLYTAIDSIILSKKHAFKRIISILLAVILVLTTLPSTLFVEGVAKGNIQESNETFNNLPKTSSFIKDFINYIKAIVKEGFPLYVATNYSGYEKITKMRLFRSTEVDVNDDGKNDISVRITALPSIDVHPLAFSIQTRLKIRRLSGMNDIKNDFLEVFLEYRPTLLSAITNEKIDRIRVGYQSPDGEEIPSYCTVYYKIIPYILYPKKKISFKAGIDPGSISGKDQLNLIFSVANIENDTISSETLIQVNNTPAIKNEIAFNRYKDKLIGRGRSIEITRKYSTSSNVTLILRDINKDSKGTLTIRKIPRRITLSWLFGLSGYIKINSYGSLTGRVDAKVDDVISLGFTPEKDLDVCIEWGNLLTGKPFVELSVYTSFVASDIYLYMPKIKISDIPLTGIPLSQPIILSDFELITSLLSINLNLSAGINVTGRLIFHPNPYATAKIDVSNADVVLEGCNLNIDMHLDKRPTAYITSLLDGETVSGTVLIKGNASSSDPAKAIEWVRIQIDDNEWRNVSGTTNWSYYWDTTKVLNGMHTISVKCFDGEYESFPTTIRVNVSNPGVNYYPIVEIKEPPNYAILSGEVFINGTANDPDGTIKKVEIRIGKGDWIEVEGTTQWSYLWNTSSLPVGMKTIYARSYDGQNYSPTVSVTVFIKNMEGILELNLSESTLRISNLEIHGDLPIVGNVSDIYVSSIMASGNGHLKVGEGAIFVNVSGEFEISQSSVYAVLNSSSETIALFENLTIDFDGEGLLLISEYMVLLELDDVSLYLHADYIYDFGEITLGLRVSGSFSAYMYGLNVSIDASSFIDIK